MRMSCNGCRVLRKGCSDHCSIRPCLLWITSADSQAHATLFLAKFYGRAGLINLLNSGPEHLRPAIFRSLLYEACGRIVNPVHGSAGLLWSGNWQLCQDAVDAVLRGIPITTIACSSDDEGETALVKGYDIRHVTKDGLHRVKSTLTGRFKHKAKRAYRCRSSSHESSMSHETIDDSLVVSSAVQEDSKGEVEGELELQLTLGLRPCKAELGVSTLE